MITNFILNVAISIIQFIIKLVDFPVSNAIAGSFISFVNDYVVQGAALLKYLFGPGIFGYMIDLIIFSTFYKPIITLIRMVYNFLHDAITGII